jgi:hypothetical protein
MTMYHRIYKTITYRDTDYLLTKSGDGTRKPGANCAFEDCTQYFYVTYGKNYFHFVNWDNNNWATADMRLVDVGLAYHL